MEQNHKHLSHTLLKEMFLMLLPKETEGKDEPQAGSLGKKCSPMFLLCKIGIVTLKGFVLNVKKKA